MDINYSVFQLSTYFDMLNIDPIALVICSIPPLLLFLIVYLVRCSKVKSVKQSSDRTKMKEMEDLLIMNTTAIEGLTLTVGKLRKVVLQLQKEINEMQTKNDDFTCHYEEFYNKVMNELKILKDATFVPDENDNDHDSDFDNSN